MLGWWADLSAANHREPAASSGGLLCSHQWYVLSGGVPNLVDHSQLWLTAQVARFVSIGVFRVGVVGSFGVLLPATSCLSPVTFRAGIARGKWSLLWSGLGFASRQVACSWVHPAVAAPAGGGGGGDA